MSDRRIRGRQQLMTLLGGRHGRGGAVTTIASAVVPKTVSNLQQQDI